MKEYFKTFNGGKGLDHWSPTSSQNFTRFLINYSLPQEVRRSFKIRYKAPFGNLTNNTAQRLKCEVLFEGDKRVKLTNKNYDDVFNQELENINKNSEPVDEKDKIAREVMLEAAHQTIQNIFKVLKEIFGNEKLVAERYVAAKLKDMIHDIIGRIDYESNNAIGEAKTKPPSLRKKKGRDEYYLATTHLPTEPDPLHASQLSFYYHCTKRKPFLFYVNEKDYVIFDDSHERLSRDYLEEQYNLMTQKLMAWEQLIIFCKGDLNKLSHFAEPPELNHPFYYRDLIQEQKENIKQLWGINA
jgi:hypothetical protein